MSDPRTKQLSIVDEPGVDHPAGSFITSGGPVVDWQKVFLPRVVGGRLTVDNIGLAPVTTGELFDKSEVFYVPYVGTSISLYDGSEWIMHDFFPYLSKLISSLDVNGDPIDPGTSYDVYVALQNGLPALEFEPWVSVGIDADTRTVDPVYFEGALVRGDDSTRRYVGMVRTKSATDGGKFEDSYSHLFVWNALNQVNRVAILNETATDITFSASFGSSFDQLSGATIGFTEFINGVNVKCRCDAIVCAKTTGAQENGVTIRTMLDDNFSGAPTAGSPSIGNLSGRPVLPYTGNSTSMWSSIDIYIDPNYHSFKISMGGAVDSASIIVAPDGPDAGPNIARPGQTVTITG